MKENNPATFITEPLIKIRSASQATQIRQTSPPLVSRSLKHLDEDQAVFNAMLKEFTEEYRQAWREIKKVEKQIQQELEKQVDISRKPKDLPQLYKDHLQSMNTLKKKLWYRLYKYWHEPFIEKNYADDKLLLLKQQTAYKKRMKKRLLEAKQQKSGQQPRYPQPKDQNDSDSIDIEHLIKETKQNLNDSNGSNITQEFMNEGDDPENDEMAQIISKKVDPFNINHKKNQNLYRETLLECIGLKPFKLVKNVVMPSFYVSQHNKKQNNLQHIIRKEMEEKRLQICEPTKKRERETRKVIKKDLQQYVANINICEEEKLDYAKVLKTDIQEQTHLQQRQMGGQMEETGSDILSIPRVMTSNDYQEVYHNKKRMPYTQRMLEDQQNQYAKSKFRIQHILLQTERKKLNTQQQTSQTLTARQEPQNEQNSRQPIITRVPRYARVKSQGELQLQKFYERIDQTSQNQDNNLAFQSTRQNILNYPCINTQTLIEKAREALVMQISQKKISDIHQANQIFGIPLQQKKEKLLKIAQGQVMIPYDSEVSKRKYRQQQKDEALKYGGDAIEVDSDTSGSDVSFKEFQSTLREIMKSRKKEKDTLKMRSYKYNSSTNTPRDSISTAQNSRMSQPLSFRVSNQPERQTDDMSKAQQVFSQCRQALAQSSKEMQNFNKRETVYSKDFDFLKERATHRILLESDDVKMSVEDFHSKKHIFIYNKDLSKGYFLRIDPHRINEIAKVLQTFKFKEPKIVADDIREADEIEKKRLEKYYHKKFKSVDLTAKQLRPKFTEKFIQKVQASTEMCTMKLKEKLQVK